MMHHIVLLATFFASLGVITTPANGDDAIPNADTVIQTCWRISQDKRNSESTQSQRAGHLDTALCLENQIATNMEKLVSSSRHAPKSIRTKLERIRFAFGGLYWAIYNDHRGCDNGCGTIYQSFHNSALAKLYEGILRDVIAQRKKYGV